MRIWGLTLSFIQNSVSGRIGTSEKVIKSLKFVREKYVRMLFTLSSNNNIMYLVLVLNNGT